MEAEEITKLVDGVYKNILDKFNPGARQLITAGKNYLKALHGAASASRLFNEALAKIAINAQQSGTSDIGAGLMNVVTVYKEIQDQQMNILKAFYVDLLVPLETNLEKDTKVVQHEQKKFMQQHKVRMESYQKAISTMKKQRKKKATPENTEKELRSLQLLEDQKKKLDAFCEQSYKNALTQERRRYGFVLERQCSIAKHWMAYHATGKSVIDSNLENWEEIAALREIIPAAAYESSFNTKRLERIKDVDDVHQSVSGGGGGGAGGSIGASQLKKARSVDAPYGDMRTLHETSTNYSQNSLPRAKSDFNLTKATMNSSDDHADHHGHWDQRPVVSALYAYMPSGENQLPFEEGDSIALVGSKAKGWQFGENLRTQMFGWFPIAYTNANSEASNNRHDRSERERNDRYENMHYERNSRGGGGSSGMRSYQEHQYISESRGGENALESDSIDRRRNNSAEESSPTRMFGDTINFRNQKKYLASTGANPRPGPPPTLPAPVPSISQTSQGRILNSSQSFCAPNGASSMLERRKHKALNGPQAPHNRSMLSQMKQSSSMGHMTGTNIGNQSKSAVPTKTSLHSSNDSGFANEPPPQPEVDYSDEEQASRVPIRRRAETNSHSSREVASWTLNRNFRNSVDSQIDDKSLNAFGKTNGGKMRYDLIASDDEILQASSGGIKRTKSFWKFGGGRNEDILAGMSLWQHRDLVAAPNLDELRREHEQMQTQQQQQQHSQQPQRPNSELEREFDKNGTLTKSNSNNSSTPSSRNEKRRKESVTSMEAYDDDDNIYGMSPVVANMRGEDSTNGQGILAQHTQQQQTQMQQQQIQQQHQQRNSSTMPTTMVANYTPKSRMKIMKTIEIDIENPTEDERLSTLKRGQKEYQREMQQQQHQNTLPNMKSKQHQQQQSQQHQQVQQRNFNARKLHEPTSKSNQSQSQSHALTTLGQHSRNKHQSAPLSAQHEMMLNSTEDEDASDDNGTLKMSDVNNFFDGLPHDGINTGMIMKTVKRKDILKQYYTSEDDESDVDVDVDVEIKSTSSDPYDCIVINDHLVRKDEKYRGRGQKAQQALPTTQQTNSYHQEHHQMEFQTFRSTTKKSTTTSSSGQAVNDLSSGGKSTKKINSSKQQIQQNTAGNMVNTHSTSSANESAMNTPTATILPRTRLMKSSSATLERSQQKSKAATRQSSESVERGERGTAAAEKDKQHYGNKTYGPWYDFWDQKDHHTLVSQMSMSNSKMK